MSAQPTTTAVLSGPVPPLAVGFNSRQETGFRLADGLRPGETVLLVPAQGGEPMGDAAVAGDASAPDGGPTAIGGTGKTQLAVGFAHQMWSTRSVDLLVWVAAGNRTAIVSGYARAAADLHLAEGGAAVPGVGAGETADSGARRFLDWLGRTQRRWAVVLDGVTSAVDLDGLWPEGPSGQVVVTSRLRADELADPAARRIAYGIPAFSRREAVGYLNTRLVSFPDQRIEALDLAEDIGGLPLAMAQAAAVIVAAESTCREYRAEYAQRLRSTAPSAIDGCPPSLVAAWSLAVEYAHELPPAGLAWPALAFASMLDTGGIPAAVLTAPAACGYITGRPDVSVDDAGLVKSAYATLERLGLASVDNASGARTVRLHSSVRACVRAYLTPASIDQVVQAAATALVEAWPTASASTDLSQALRDCTAALHAFAGDLLWKPEAHAALVRAGASLMEGPVLADAAIRYWQAMAGASGQLLGPGHAQSVLARDQLADAYAAAGRHGEALAATEAKLADRERMLGAEHPDTVAARISAARSLEAADRTAEAIALYEQALGSRERMFGSAHPETLAVRAQLAAAYSAAGRRGDSIRLYEQTRADAERSMGPLHPDTLTAGASLAAAYQAAGQRREAISAYQRAVADRERAFGAEHPDTLAVRAQLANAYRLGGKLKDAIAQYERVLADRSGLLGDDHADTITARGNLAYAYRTAGRLKDAVPQYERVVADRSRVLGPDHRDTIASRAILGAAYQQAHRMRDAVEAFERAVADGDQVLGPGDEEALTTRYNLAVAYSESGRLTDAVKILRRTVADCERHLGPDHPMTGTVRDHLAAATK
ncbi:MAG TPA: tetratricopeptide repeat protein [Trebonia sp.]|jgi:tetratricopeptide (TPR) repeat protein|nr:tetratricopeptide repeat protein [Trebonia sp.]